MDYLVKVEAFEEGMTPNLMRLFQTYFDDGSNLLNPNYIKWLYQQNPFGRAKVVYICQDDQWVGFMALIPVILRKNSDDLSAYFVVNVLVDPSHQGRNLFARMITAACEFAKNEKSALLGHPNAAAHKFWQRKKMHFHEELRPALVMPGLSRWAITSQKVNSSDIIDGASHFLRKIGNENRHWKVLLTPEYLQWRFLEHPSNCYTVQVLSKNERVIGVQITKRLRTGANLLIDQFVEARFKDQALARLPIFTVCFVPDAIVSEMTSALFRLPIKKRIPFFLTNFSEKILSEDASEMLLTASDL